MIISRTPFRISFFGGGTDYPEWYGEHGGCVLATTIDKYCYISVRELPPFFDHRFRVVYSIVENVKEIGADLLVLFSDIDGLYTAPPLSSPDARHIPVVPAITPAIVPKPSHASTRTAMT